MAVVRHLREQISQQLCLCFTLAYLLFYLGKRFACAQHQAGRLRAFAARVKLHSLRISVEHEWREYYLQTGC